MTRPRRSGWNRAALLLCGALALASCAQPRATPTLTELLASDDEHASFRTLRHALHDAGVDRILEGNGPFTVFAPTDAAFARISTPDLIALLADHPRFVAVMLQHVALGRITSDRLGEIDYTTTVRGGSLAVDAHPDGPLAIHGARLLIRDVPARNGVLHVIDAVLLPPEW